MLFCCFFHFVLFFTYLSFFLLLFFTSLVFFLLINSNPVS